MVAFPNVTNAPAFGVAKLSYKPQTAADATALVGATFDRTLLSFPGSCEVETLLAYTDASGVSGATHTCLTQLYHGDASNMSDETVLKSKSVVVSWVSDAAKQVAVTMPADLSAAKRYLRAKFTVTKAGTVTVSAQTSAQLVRFGGLQTIPAAAYLDAGYFESTDTAV